VIESKDLGPAARSVERVGDDASMADWAAELVDRARREGVELTGADGLLTALVGQVLQRGLEVEMTDDVGYERHDPAGRGTGNGRNGHYPKTVSSEVGDIELRVPRDRNATFEPVTVPKGQRRLDGLAGQVISLYAKGLTTGRHPGAFGRDVRHGGVAGHDQPHHRRHRRGHGGVAEPPTGPRVPGDPDRRHRGEGP
jgi:hypothetical protein